MDSVSLQQFLQLRESALARMQPTAQTKSTSSSQASSWQSVLEAKRNELGMGSQSVSRSSNSTSSQETLPTRDFRSRAIALQNQMAQGLPVRSVGNLLDVRA